MAVDIDTNAAAWSKCLVRQGSQPGSSRAGGGVAAAVGAVRMSRREVEDSLDHLFSRAYRCSCVDAQHSVGASEAATCVNSAFLI